MPKNKLLLKRKISINNTNNSKSFSASADNGLPPHLFTQGLISHKLLQKKSRSLRSLAYRHKLDSSSKEIDLDERQNRLMIMGCIKEEENLSHFEFEEDLGENTFDCFQKASHPAEVEDITFDVDTQPHTPQTRSDSFEAGNSTTLGCHQQGPQEDSKCKLQLIQTLQPINAEEQLDMIDQMLDFCYI